MTSGWIHKAQVFCEQRLCDQERITRKNRWLTVLELDKTQKRVLIENNVNEDEVATDNVNKVELNEGIQDTDAV